MQNSKLRGHFQFWGFITPALIIYFLFGFYPVLNSLFYSFTVYDGISGHFQWVWFKNFIEMFTNDSQVLTAAKHNLIWAVYYIVIQNILALFFAVLLDRKIKGKNIYRAVFFLPVIISSVASSFVWSFILSPNMGSLNFFLKSIGLGQFAFDWLGNFDLALFSVMFVDLWKNIGFNIVIFLAGLQTIPEDLLQAADIDGASGVRKFISVTFPILLPTVGMVMTLSANSALRAFDTVYLMTSGGPGDSTVLIMTKLINEAFSKNRFGYASAMAWVIFIILLLVAGAQSKFTKEKEV
jgi:raffinose/stachyose/melibiose transport system permease protein